MDWMYKRPGETTADKEEYLLGKTVDNKTYEESHRLGGAIIDATPAPLLGRREEKPAFPSSSSQPSQVDIARKVHEDPLVKIKLAERDKLKKARDKFIAHNIGKVKELKEKGLVVVHKEVASEQESLDSIVVKKLDMFFDSTRLQREREDLKKLNALIKMAFRSKKKELSQSSSGSSSGESSDENDRRKARRRRHSPSRSPKRRQDERPRRRSPEKARRRHDSPESRSPSPPPPPRRPYIRQARRPSGDRPRRHSPYQKHRQEDRTRRSDERPRGRPSRSRSPPPRRRSPQSNRNGKPEESQHPFRAKKPKLSAEEIEKKRREMMDNAEWREEQRKKNVEKLNAEEAREERLLRESGGKSEAFVATIGNSVESAIKANRKKYQKRGEFMSRD